MPSISFHRRDGLDSVLGTDSVRMCPGELCPMMGVLVRRTEMARDDRDHSQFVLVVWKIRIPLAFKAARLQTKGLTQFPISCRYSTASNAVLEFCM